MLKQINKEIRDYESRDIHVVPGLTFNQKDTIEKIFYYYNSKYQTGEIDDEGDRKYFLNINKNPCKVFAKAVDFDTKNIRLLTTEGGDPLKTWFMERDLKYWMRDVQFGRILNRLFKELPIYGSVVLKIVDGMPQFVDLRNFIVQQSADTLDDSNFIIEIHNYSPTSFRKVGKEMGWDNIDEVIEEFHKMKETSHIRVFERYGPVEEMNSKGKKSYPYKRVFHADVGLDEYDQRDTKIAYLGFELSSTEFEGHPYWEFHAEKIPGRWLGVGVVESLFEPQIRQNELSNLQAKASYWMALQVFQTRDATVNRNMLTDVRNGEVLNVDSEITKIDISERNLAYFNQEHQKWQSNRDELTFSFDVVQGERLPAGTPLGSAKLAASQTMSYFQLIQENIALDVKEMLYQVIIPHFEKKNKGEHTLRLVGQDLDTYVQLVKNELVAKEVIRIAIKSLNGGKFPTNEDRDVIGVAIEESIKQGKEKMITIPKGFYKNLKYEVDIDITGESIDTQVRSATRFAILQAITADPTMTQDPTKKKILAGMAEDGGINPNDLFETTSQPQEQAPQRAGGGVSAPALGQAVPGQVEQTV